MGKMVYGSNNNRQTVTIHHTEQKAEPPEVKRVKVVTQKHEPKREVENMMRYRDGDTYKALVRIIENAGVKIVYRKMPDDIAARADNYGQNLIEMPDDEEYDEEQACLLLGHEMGHILSGMTGHDERHWIDECTCDVIGAYLTFLAEMTAGYEMEKALMNASIEESEAE